MNIKAIKINIDQTKNGYQEETTMTFYNDKEQFKDEKEHIQNIVIEKLKQLKSFDEPSRIKVTLSVLNEFYSFDDFYRFTFGFYSFCEKEKSPFLTMEHRPYANEYFEVEKEERLMIDANKNFNREKNRLTKMFIEEVLNTFENKISEMERVL